MVRSISGFTSRMLSIPKFLAMRTTLAT